MTNEPNRGNPAGSAHLVRLSDEDRARLGEAVQELLAHGSILGLDAGRSALYHWCRQYFDW